MAGFQHSRPAELSLSCTTFLPCLHLTGLQLSLIVCNVLLQRPKQCHLLKSSTRYDQTLNPRGMGSQRSEPSVLSLREVNFAVYPQLTCLYLSQSAPDTLYVVYYSSLKLSPSSGLQNLLTTLGSFSTITPTYRVFSSPLLLVPACNYMNFLEQYHL